MAFACEKHGKVISIGNSKPNYCPICGKKTIAIFFLPKIYIDNSVFKAMLLLIVVTAALFYIITNINSCNKENEKLMTDMPTAWRSLYEQINSSPSSREIEVCENFVKVNSAKLNKYPPLKSSDVKLILSACTGVNSSEVSKLLQPYMVSEREIDEKEAVQKKQK